ncbi:MAG: ABC transporter permease [Bacteroidales bacterium]|nr:ABC transporter permease [Bacteroidales bacterium]
MNKLLLIIQREYVQMVCKKSFIITTLLVPVLSIVLCIVLPVMLAEVKSEEKKNVAVVDQNPDAPYARLLADTDDFHFVGVTDANEEDASEFDAFSVYEAEKNNQEIYALVVIPNRFADNPTYNIYSEKSVNGNLERSVTNSLQDAVRAQRIESYGIDSLENIINYCNPHIQSTNIKWSDSGEESLSSADLSMILGFVLSMLTYMFVIIYGAMIMNSVVEEKTNRIVEVIVSTCKPMQLMMGKIVGVALVGLTQLFIWGLLIGIIGTIFGVSALAARPELAQAATDPAVAQTMQELQSNSEMSKIVQMILSVNYMQIFVCFILYFIGGYLLYASLFAAFGSAVDQASDASQFTAPIMMIMIFALYAGMFCMNNPDGPLAFWCSMIPFTSPVVMMIRLPYDLPWYELAGSLALLFATAFGIIWLSSRIYRTGILMYGRKFSLKEIFRWIRNS